MLMNLPTTRTTCSTWSPPSRLSLTWTWTKSNLSACLSGTLFPCNLPISVSTQINQVLPGCNWLLSQAGLSVYFQFKVIYETFQVIFKKLPERKEIIYCTKIEKWCDMEAIYNIRTYHYYLLCNNHWLSSQRASNNSSLCWPVWWHFSIHPNNLLYVHLIRIVVSLSSSNQHRRHSLVDFVWCDIAVITSEFYHSFLQKLNFAD